MGIRVQDKPIEIDRLYQAVITDRHHIGAVVMFVGLVRDFLHVEDERRALVALTLEHYPGMTERKLAEIESEARERWDLEECLIVHRHGRMTPGEPIVLVITAAQHRDAAYEANRFVIDFLKTRAPFWKLQETAEGGAHWVDARVEDAAATRRWGG